MFLKKKKVRQGWLPLSNLLGGLWIHRLDQIALQAVDEAEPVEGEELHCKIRQGEIVHLSI